MKHVGVVVWGDLFITCGMAAKGLVFQLSLRCFIVLYRQNPMVLSSQSYGECIDSYCKVPFYKNITEWKILTSYAILLYLGGEKIP